MQFLRYTLTGAVATSVHYALLLGLVELAQWPAGAAATTGALIGAVVAYLGNRRLAFGASTAPHRQAMPRFAAVALAGALLNGIIVGLAVGLGCHYLLAQVAATLTVLLLTYHLNKTWSFT